MGILAFYDLETTGLNYKQHCIHQLAGIIEIDGQVVEEFDYKMAPHPKAKVEKEALDKGRVTEDQVKAYPDQKIMFLKFKQMLNKYIDPYNPKQKAHLVGFNNRFFDDPFLRMWFELNGDQFIGSWFWNDTLDALVLASQYLLHRRADMPSFKQSRVAKELGLDVDEGKLHDALYDVQLARGIYRIVTGLDIEL
jgi:DNA polymerase III subunit epsilon